VSNIEVRELRQLAQLHRQPFDLIVADLEHITRSDPDHSIRMSHVEPLELCQFADFCWQRRELIAADLKAGDVGSNSNCDPPASSAAR
jgi:hypothetical protein